MCLYAKDLNVENVSIGLDMRFTLSRTYLKYQFSISDIFPFYCLFLTCVFVIKCTFYMIVW